MAFIYYFIDYNRIAFFFNKIVRINNYSNSNYLMALIMVNKIVINIVDFIIIIPFQDKIINNFKELIKVKVIIKLQSFNNYC